MTLVEILVVVGIIALLTGLLMPAISMVQKAAKNAKQMAQFTAIELGLEAYKADFGEYPPSDPNSYKTPIVPPETSIMNSAGALKLAEAMLGLDLMGVHPDTGFRVDGMNRWPYVASNSVTYAPGTYLLYDRTNTIEMQKRKGRYVELDVANPFQWGMTTVHDGLYDLSSCGPCAAAADCPLLCDVFGKGKDVILSNTNGTHKRAGRPILYYRANPAYKFLNTTPGATFISTYNSLDNDNMLGVIEMNDFTRMGTPHGAFNWNPLSAVGALNSFITDPRVSTTTSRVAYRPDSYILISAGADGFYGTSDDICNFGR
jgi:type II secretory pathway pseudopilin PulG